MSSETLLRLAYGANIVILAPVLAGLLLARNGPNVPAIGGAVAESQGLRLLVASLWGAILVLSALGLAAPVVFWPVLLLQIVYKSAWLAGYVGPTWRTQGARAVPWGPSVCFAAIVVLWPLILIRAWQDGTLAGLG